MQALILSGGMGTRLRPLTLYAPKPLLPIANVPHLSYPLALLRAHGVAEAVLCTAEALGPYRPFIREEKKLGTTVRCSRETSELGTAGAIRNAEKYIKSDTFFVFNGDVLTDIDLSAMIRFHKARGAKITVALVPVENPAAYGLVLTDAQGRIRQFIEKPKELLPEWGKKFYINAGIYLFDRSVLARIPKGKKHSTERELFPGCLADGIPFYGFHADGAYWLDIGKPESYLKGNIDALDRSRVKMRAGRGQSRIAPGSAVHRTAELHATAVIGKKCRIGARAQLKNCVILDGVKVEEDAVIENCVIGRGARIGRSSTVRGAQVIGDRSVLTPFCKL